VGATSWQNFKALALANIYEKVDEQFGVVRPVLVLGALLMVIAPIILMRAAMPPPKKNLVWATWAMVTIPILLVIAQRAYPPTRAVFYLAYFGLLLAALGVGYVLNKARTTQRHPWDCKTPLWQGRLNSAKEERVYRRA
jgi:hypothetical protein